MNIETVNELIASLESAGDLSIKERKYLELAKEFRICSASLDAAIKTGNILADENAALAMTFEKCREVSGCPAGVDLQDHVRLLAAENLGLKAAAEFATAPDMWIEQADGMLDYRYSDWYVDVLKAAMETPATSAYLAGIKADALPANIAEIIDSGDLEPILYASEASYSEEYRMAFYNFRQLREGAK